MKRGGMFKAAWRKEKERVAQLHRKKRDEEEVVNIPIPLGVIKGQLRRFRQPNLDES